ncbi:MAG: hypothetical protein QW220_04545 [Candidatus Bathyarchaeia archaeon]
MPKKRVMPEREGVGFEKHHKFDFECHFLRYFLVPKKEKEKRILATSWRPLHPA